MVAESNKNNNQGVGAGYDTAAVQIAPKAGANLVGNSLNVVPVVVDPTGAATTVGAPPTAMWGGTIQVTAQIVNQSQGDAPATRAAIILTPAGDVPGDGTDVTSATSTSPPSPPGRRST